IALTVTPAMSYMLLRNVPIEQRESPVARLLHRGYERILSPIITRPRIAFASVAIFAVVGTAVAPGLGQELLPDFRERDFLMHWVTQPGTSHEEMYRITVQVGEELQAIPGVRNFGAHIGRALASDEVVGINFTENWVSIDPEADYDTTLAAIQETVDGYPGIRRDVQTYLKERVKEVLTGTSEAIVVRIYGPDLAVLRDLAGGVESRLSSIEGTVDLHTELQVEIPQIEIEVDLITAQQYGIKPGDVRRAAAAYMSSTEVGDYYRAGKALDVSVYSTPATRNSTTSLGEILLNTNTGRHVLLSDVAEVRLVSTPNEIERENVARRIDVLANVSGRDLGSVVADVEAQLATVEFPLEYRAELLGEFEERQAASRQLGLFGLVAAAAIFLLLLSSFGSPRLAILSFLTLPSALVGGILAAYAGSGLISIGSLVGFLTIYGIAARNGIMLINHYQHLEREEGETFGPHLALRGAMERLIPILMTALSTGLALIPLVIAGDIAGHEIEHPMAVVIMGGLVTSTLLNLFVVPSLYLRYGKSRAERQLAAA
ncbi:MAG: efflux RND transporter permease subunit, partial [Acidimicrobiia bacterium]|nr:efflux RND transporter permease subunit [Acidimicrobiia bacterium]